MLFERRRLMGYLKGRWEIRKVFAESPQPSQNNCILDGNWVVLPRFDVPEETARPATYKFQEIMIKRLTNFLDSFRAHFNGSKRQFKYQSNCQCLSETSLCRKLDREIIYRWGRELWGEREGALRFQHFSISSVWLSEFLTFGSGKRIPKVLFQKCRMYPHLLFMT